MPSPLRIGLVGPDGTQPCGIADYTSRLAGSLAAKCDLVFVPFRHALNDGDLAGCRAILVQYERSLVPDAGFLPALAARHPGRVYVVPHEVYAEDPFAFPYADLRAAFPPILWLKRLRYRWDHRDYAREKRLQANGYAAQGVIPLSGPGRDILRPLAGKAILEPVPHAYYPVPEPVSDAPAVSPVGSGSDDASLRAAFFPEGAKAVVGIFGFLNPGLDYGVALDLLADSDPGVKLLILGGPRGSEARKGLPGAGGSGPDDPVKRWLDGEVAARGLGGRVQVTGYLPENRLAEHFRLCDLFLCPMRFKSNSGSLLHLIHLGKPILAAALPLTRYLQDQGAPLELYTDRIDLRKKAAEALDPAFLARPNRYPWTFDAVADAYLRILAA
ncbi:MAG: hypothetical protein JWP91_1534 [Fibrobacteres bacterium]|nr:hypothetical protein [Fibrobacterota bacterium]